MDKFQVLSRNEEETARIAKAIASSFRFGDVAILDGDLGSGKTLFVKALSEALGSSDNVSSPTFTIANFYRIPGGFLLHADAYRLSGQAEFEDLGLSEFFPQSIVMIEWGLKVIDEFDEYLQITFEFVSENPDHRIMNFSCAGGRWASEFQMLNQMLSNL